MFIFHFLPGFVRQKWCYPFRFNMRIGDLVTSEVIFPFIAQRLSSDVCVYCNCPICCVCLRCVLYMATSMNPSEKIRSNKSSKSLNFAKLEQCYFRIFLSICGRVSSSCAVTCYGTSPLYPKTLGVNRTCLGKKSLEGQHKTRLARWSSLIINTRKYKVTETENQ